MANRFNKIIDQEYVGMPFQEILAAASIRQKTGDTNKALYDDANTMLSKYAAIPQSADEEYKKTSEKAIEGIISNYISDPNKLYNPNTMYNFKREINQAVDFNRLKLGNDSYGMYGKDIENQKLLQSQDKFNADLVPTDWQGWDSRKGIYDKFTPAYSKSFDTTADYIKDYRPHVDIDAATGQPREWVDINDLAKQAQSYAPQYIDTPSFRNEFALALKQGHPAAVAGDKQALAQEILMRDWSYKLKDLDGKGWGPGRGRGKGAGEKAQTSIPDWGFDRMTNPNSPLTTADLATVTGTDPMTYKIGPNEIQANQVKFDPESTINAYGTILRPQNAMQATAFDGILKLENLYKQAAGKVGGVDMETYLNPLWFDGLSNMTFKVKTGEHQPSEDDVKARNKIFEETLATKKQLEYSLKQITGKDYSKDNLVNPAVRNEAFRDVLKASGLDKKFTSIEDAMSSLTVLGSALDAVNNGSTGPFVPSSGKSNKTYTVDENGEYVMNVNGTRYITKQEMDIAFEGKDLDWEDKFVKEEGGNGLIKRMSGEGDEATYAIPTSIRVPMTNDAMDRINKGEYSAEQREKYSDYNHAKRQEIAQDRMLTARAGSEFLSSLGEADKAMNEFINTADEDILRGAGYTKKSLRDEYQKAIGSGDTFKIGEFARKQHDLTLNNKYMQALAASEGTNGQQVQNYAGSGAIGTHQVMYSSHKDLFKRYGIDGGSPEKSLDLIKKNPSKYKAMVSDLVSQTRKEAEYISQNNPESPYGQDEMVALTYFLGAGNLQNYLDLLAQTNGNEAQAWSMMDKKVTKNNVMPSQYLSKFNAKLNT